MPIFDFRCQECGSVQERYVHTPGTPVNCACGGRTTKLLSGSFSVREKYPLWVDRIDEHQKRQVDRGEQPTTPPAREVL